MKTYTLEVLEPGNESLVADILAALRKQRLIEFVEVTGPDNPTLLSTAEVEADVLTARHFAGRGAGPVWSMSAGNLQLVVTPTFMNRVSAVEQYLGRENPAASRVFVSALFDFLAEAVEPFPLAFPSYTLPRYPGIELRRAVFRRRYNVVYEVTAIEIRCLAFFATAQDAGSIEL